MQPASERRKFWRTAFNAPVKLVNDVGSVDAVLDDISLKGALLEAPPEWKGEAGEHCYIKLRLGGGPDMKITMWGRIAHLDGRKIGLLCESIDIDSITHLRRLVELNTGDPTLLERELSALVQGD